jgi:hypothetical protein
MMLRSPTAFRYSITAGKLPFFGRHLQLKRGSNEGSNEGSSITILLMGHADSLHATLDAKKRRK